MEPDDIYKKDQPPPLARRHQGGGAPPPDGIRGAAHDGPAIAPRVVKLDEFRSSRSRRHRSRGKEKYYTQANKALWGSVSLVVLGYLLALVVSFFHKPARPKPVAAKPAQLASAQHSPASSNESPREASAVQQDITQRIREWSAALHGVSEASDLQNAGKLDQAALQLSDALKTDADLASARFGLAEIRVKQERFREAEDLLFAALASDPTRLDARQMLAKVYASQRQFGASLAVAMWLIDDDPYSMDAHTLAAQAYMNLDQPDMAVSHWKKVVNVQRDNVVALNSLAQAYQKMGKNGDAVEVLKNVLEVDGRNSSSYFNLAVSYAQLGSVENAVDILTKAAVLFGNTFVESWTQAADFETIRTNSIFTEFQSMLSRPGALTAQAAEEAGATGAEESAAADVSSGPPAMP